jgi:hypothetical protein
MDKQSVVQRLKMLNIYQLFSYRPELKVVPATLPEGETLEAATAGISNGKRWMLVFGRMHVYFIHVHPINGTHTRKVPYADLTDYQVSKGLLFGKIVLDLGQETIKVENCHRRTMGQVQAVLDDYAA